MKKITLFTTLFLAVFCLGTKIQAQKVAIIGYNGITTDGISIVALENIPANTVIRFTDKPYLGGGSFGINESVWSYTTPSPNGLSIGDVVVFNEAAGGNQMEMACNLNGNPLSGGSCGTASPATGSLSYASTGETVYAYEDTDNDPSSGVTAIYAALTTNGAFSDSNPATLSPNVVIVDAPNGGHVDFKNSLRSSVGVSKATIIAALTGPNTNYNEGTSYIALSTTPFSAPSNPVLTMTGPSNPVAEDGTANLEYTFTLTPAPTSNVTVNFKIDLIYYNIDNLLGNAFFSSDYTLSGEASFSSFSYTGTIVIPTSGSATLTIDPIADGTLEPNETVTISPLAGTGYDLGGGGATGTIVNDDILSPSCPWVAITGMNHTDADGFSFVALDDIPAFQRIYFTENEFNNTTLTFDSDVAESVLYWRTPAGGVQRGEVFVVKETSPNTFSLSCTDGSGNTCGVFRKRGGVGGDFAPAETGDILYAYGDTDSIADNGITEIYSVLYTGDIDIPATGGDIPALWDPSLVYANAVVVDGFPATNPNRTEYKESLRNVTVSQGNFEDITKWDHGQANADLSTTPFNNIIIKTGSANSPVTVTVSPGAVNEDSGNSMVFTFTLNGPAQGDFDVSFQVSGTATYLTDYTVSTQGLNSSFNATTGVVTIINVLDVGTITITPVADSGLEPDETVTLSIVSGTNYDAGSPGVCHRNHYQ
jgi:hypothetical protein